MKVRPSHTTKLPTLAMAAGWWTWSVLKNEGTGEKLIEELKKWSARFEGWELTVKLKKTSATENGSIFLRLSLLYLYHRQRQGHCPQAEFT